MVISDLESNFSIQIYFVKLKTNSLQNNTLHSLQTNQNVCNWWLARENLQPMASAGKRDTRAKRGKIYHPWKARETMLVARSAGNVPRVKARERSGFVFHLTKEKERQLFSACFSYTALFFWHVDDLLTLIGKGVGYDWIALGQQLGFTDSELQEISDRQWVCKSSYMFML